MKRAWQGVVGIACALAAPAAAEAHGLDAPQFGPEAQRFAFEAQVLGTEHALAHLAQRRAPRAEASQEAFDPCRPRGDAGKFDFNRPRPPRDRPTGQARCGTLPAQPRTKAKLARVGRWTRDVQDLPHYAIHAVHLTSGKVLFWGFEWTQNIITRNPADHQDVPSGATIWDPAKGNGRRAFRSVPAPMIDIDGDGRVEPVPLYCSGQSLLPDGRVLVTGGTLDLRWAERGYKNPPGIKIVLIFDPRTESWSRAPDMATARWYPTQVKLADGRTVVLGGFDDAKPVNDFTSMLEIVSADGRSVSRVPQADRRTWTYPGLALMPSGRVLLAGPQTSDVGLLDTATMRWAALPPIPVARGGSNLVPVPTRTGVSPQAMLIGGADFTKQFTGPEPEPRAHRSTLVFDDRRTAWRATPNQHRPRNWPNTVLLPDGTMATFGGGTQITVKDLAYTSELANRRVELWDPATRRWRLGPAQREDRTYHSVAVLLEDGRVWSSGDDANPNRDGDTGEIYEPPYLFKGPRPRITAAPKRLKPRRTFTMTVRGPAPERVTLLAPSATTHALDMNQRFVELRVRRARTRGDRTVLTVDGPRSLTAAPPGPWMLFALSARGAASAARWTSVR